MRNELVTFEREFRIWTYLSSHSQLVLRSAKGKEHATRVDVLFKSVYFWNGGVYLADLRIFEVSRDELTKQFWDLSGFEEPGVKWFLLQTSKWTGCVCAGAVYWKEDNGEFHEPSQLIPELKHPGEKC